MDFYAHPTAVIDPGVNIGAESHIWHFTHICSGAIIGRKVTLGQGVFVGGKAKIGNNCKVQNSVNIYDDVTLEDDVFCGPQWSLRMCIIRGTD